MSQMQSLRLPDSLERQLADYRREVWRVKLTEAIAGAVFGLIVAFLVLFALDRLLDTPSVVRWIIFVVALAAGAVLPLQLHRWVWGYRRSDQLAQLLARSMPRLGDQLLGVIELVRTPSEQSRSPALCQAAVTQVARDTQAHDLRTATPPAHQRLWVSLALVVLIIATALAAIFPAASGNAAMRLAAPWRDIPRYTFATFTPLPDRLIIPHGEPFELSVQLTDATRRRPAQGQLQLGRHAPLTADLQMSDHYAFAMPPLVEPVDLRLRIGDAIQRLRVEPTLRPELTAIEAQVALPEYLQRTDQQQIDVRGGAVSLVKGSAATFAVTANRALASGRVDQQPHTPQGSKLTSTSLTVEENRTLEFDWQDELGLSGRNPLRVTISARDDQSPAVGIEGLPRRSVVLDSQQLTFKVQARDDFGVRRVGLVWQSASDLPVSGPTEGERVLAAGGPEADQLEATGTFSAAALGIEPQPILVRVYVEDYFPGRPRVYSSPSLLYVLDPQQHAIWLTEQLSKWHRESLEVRDRERQLHETNKRLRDLPTDQLDRPEVRREIADQAAAERANGRRLTGLTSFGDELLKQASRNPEFGVGYLESWSEMLQILKDIAASRMPSVADLLTAAAEAPKAADGSPSSPMAGMVRASGGAGQPAKTADDEQKEKAVSPPKLVDLESSQQPIDPAEPQEPKEKKGSGGAPLRLPATTLLGGGGKKDGESCPAGEAVEQAVKQQHDLLAEFDRIADELERVLGNLEGSTLVKRLKAASRLQAKLADQVSERVESDFGTLVSHLTKSSPEPTPLETVATQHDKCSQDVSLIMDDLEAFYERRRLVKFKEILAEMRQEDVVGGLRHLSETVRSEVGTSMALSEFWSDTLDRWAEDLVDPSNCGQCPGGKSAASLPPSLVLEVLQILEGEVNLREETRVVQQARAAQLPEEYGEHADKLAQTQKGLQERIERVREQILELPDSEQEFGKEIQLLAAVATVMAETQEILATPETGPVAIAAETEVIELLLQSKRINPHGGGGGGSDPGGGGGGTTVDSAIALLGSGVNEREVRVQRNVSQATGQTVSNLPEEFRSGLDEYFNRLERLPEGL
jgi:hypothetical protein